MSYYKGVWLIFTWIFSVPNGLQNLFFNSIYLRVNFFCFDSFFWEEMQPIINCPASYTLVIWQLRVQKKKILLKRDCAKGRNSHPDVFCKNGVLQSFTIYMVQKLHWCLFSINSQVFSVQRCQKTYFNLDFLLWFLQNF